MFQIQADWTALKLLEKEPITTGSVQAQQVQFIFSDDWSGITKTAVFVCGDVQISTTVDSSGYCYIPWECLVEENLGEPVFGGVYGTSGSSVVVPTIYCRLGMLVKGANLGDNASDPTASVYEQFVSDISGYASAAATSASAAASSASAASKSASAAATSATEAAEAASNAAAEAYDDVISILNGITWSVNADDGGLDITIEDE